MGFMCSDVMDGAITFLTLVHWGGGGDEIKSLGILLLIAVEAFAQEA